MDRFERRLIDYSLDEDQESIRSAFQEFFTKECPTTRVRDAEPLGYDADLWHKLVQMGVTTMSLPESAGGDGASLVDLVLAAEQYGAAIAPVPFVSHVVATRLLVSAGAEASLVSDALGGDRLFAIALEPVVGLRPQLVPDAAIARDVLALEGESLILVTSAAPGTHAPNQGSTPLAWWDSGRGAKVVLASGPAALELYRRAVAEWKLLTAAALTSLTESALADAVEFAKTRETLGVPIGSLQGVSYMLADISVATSGSRNLVRRAAWMLEYEPGERPELVPMAFANATRAATKGTASAVHVQGGLGFMIEADASLYFLRAKGWSVLSGDPEENYVTVGELIAAASGSA